jgi:hypothetical protein
LKEKIAREALAIALHCFIQAERLHPVKPGKVCIEDYPLDWSGLPNEERFWDWKLGPVKVHYP